MRDSGEKLLADKRMGSLIWGYELLECLYVLLTVHLDTSV